MKKRGIAKWIILAVGCVMVALIGGIGLLYSLSSRPESPILVEYSWMPSYGCETDFYTTHIRIYNDGTVDVYGSFEDEDYIEGGTFQISEQEVEYVRKVMDRHPFLWNKENLTDYGSCDGSYCSLAIYDENEEPVATVGGYNPMNVAFNSVSSAVWDVASDSYVDEMGDRIHAYVLENYGEEE